jgi:hypothetical protein
MNTKFTTPGSIPSASIISFELIQHKLFILVAGLLILNCTRTVVAPTGDKQAI